MNRGKQVRTQQKSPEVNQVGGKIDGREPVIIQFEVAQVLQIIRQGNVGDLVKRKIKREQIGHSGGQSKIRKFILAEVKFGDRRQTGWNRNICRRISIENERR